MKILDCTLRDGGYYNNWDFSPEIVEEYLKSIANANIDYVELGLRNFPKEEFLGAYAYTTESHLNSLFLPEGPVYGVMVDAKTILSSKMGIEDAIEVLFVPASESKISLVRVAAHFHEVEHSGPIVRKLKKMGYIVGYNLMQAGGKEADDITDKARQALSWAGLDVLYFADSLGNMDGDEVKRIVQALRNVWDGPLGIHTHNNMGKGLNNTIVAKSVGVTWLDSTITGMGRGAGNTPTETLLAVIAKEEASYNPKPIYELVIRHFEPLQKKYGWGSNLLYFLGAQNDVHPTYIQNLLSNTHYGTNEIVGAIDYLSKLSSRTSYNGSILSTALSFNSKSTAISGTTDIKSIFDTQDVLIVANGPSANKYSNSIELYIKENKPTVISVNINESLASDLIDYYVISHNSKFLSDENRYKELQKPIILPKHRFTEEELEAFGRLELLDYGLDIVDNVFSSKSTFATVPFDITYGYILAALLQSNPRSIVCVGFDGYDKNDPRQQEMITILELYHQAQNSCNIISLTPTSYPFVKGSVYAPIV